MLSPEQMGQQVESMFPNLRGDPKWRAFCYLINGSTPSLFDVRGLGPTGADVQSLTGRKGKVKGCVFVEESW